MGAVWRFLLQVTCHHRSATRRRGVVRCVCGILPACSHLATPAIDVAHCNSPLRKGGCLC